MIIESADQLPEPAQRIISLVPSQTELLFHLGLDDETIGITKFCVHPPEWLRRKPLVGGTKQLKIDFIRSLDPDLILANKEENVQAQIEALAKEFPVWVSDVANLADNHHMISTIGSFTQREEKAAQLIAEIDHRFNHLKPLQAAPTAAYLIWKEPYMTVGGDTFIHHLLQACGFQNLYANDQRYPTITVEELRQKDCEFLLLSSEPFPFSHKHQLELQYQLPNTRIVLVDGEMFSWYGSRLLLAVPYFEQLILSLSGR